MKTYVKILALSMCLVTSTALAANAFVSIDEWLDSQAAISLLRMKENISPAGTATGVVIASPSRQDPDYYFHWIRDSALVIDTVLTYSHSNAYAQSWKQDLIDFVHFSKRLQQTPTTTGLGEPRFNVDGSVFLGDWARPQNDGPALRVLTLFRGLDLVRKKSKSRDPQFEQLILDIIQTDLNYIVENWQKPSFDLWEEINGQHFYTRIVQMEALGQALNRMNSHVPWQQDEAKFRHVRDGLKAALEKHWQADKAYFSVTRDRLEGGEGYKFTDLDIAVILGVLHTYRYNGELSIRDDRVLSTAFKLESRFAAIYSINSISQGPLGPVAPAIGRYDDDVYFGGNPWYITTSAFAELHFRLATNLMKKPTLVFTTKNIAFFKHLLAATNAKKKQNQVRIGMNLKRNPELREQIISALRVRGDQFFARMQLHAPADGGLHEQFARTDGSPVSARDLTWSYASILMAIQARAEAKLLSGTTGL